MRRAGIDPGSGHLAVVITNGDTIPLSLHVQPKTFEVGRLVPRKKPIVTTSGYTLTHRRELDSPDVQKVALEVLAYLLEHSVERAVIEWIDTVHIGKKKGKEGVSPAEAAAVSTALSRTMWVAAIVGEKLEQAGIQVVRVLRATWAGRVAGTAAPKGRGRAELGPAVEAQLLGWAEHDAKRFERPAKGLEHERDAAGCAIWDALPPVEKKQRSAGTGAPRAKRRPNPPPRPRLPPPPLAEMSIFQRESPEVLAQLASYRRRRPVARGLHSSEEVKQKAVLERCTCKTLSPAGKLPAGRHKETCPLAPIPARKATGCTCSGRGSEHRRSCPLKEKRG